MNQKIKTEDIDRSHRLENQKKIKNSKPPLIVVKYNRYNTRNITYSNKIVLKGKDRSVMEILTAKKIKIIEKTRKLHEFGHIWL